MQAQSDTINLWKTFVFICRQKINFIPMLFWRYCKDMQTSYFWCFGHAWLHMLKMIVSTCRRLCMSKVNFIIHFFLEILHFKESYNLIGSQRFGPYLENQNFAIHGIGGEITTILVSILDYFQE